MSLNIHTVWSLHLLSICFTFYILGAAVVLWKTYWPCKPGGRRFDPRLHQSVGWDFKPWPRLHNYDLSCWWDNKHKHNNNIVHHSGTWCVLLYMSMFSGFNQTNMNTTYLHVLIKFLLISKYGYKTIWNAPNKRNLRTNSSEYASVATQGWNIV